MTLVRERRHTHSPMARARSFILHLPPIAWAAVVFLFWSALVFRDGVLLGSNWYPQGTNALDTYAVWWFLGKFPLGMWLSPFTDWGQPLPIFTGPTFLTPLIILVPPGTLIRLVEASSWFVSALSAYVVVRSFGGRFAPSIIGGLYYSSSVEVAQLFEGHVPAMVSLAIAPLFYLAIWRFGRNPNLKWAVASATLLYLMASIGDLGILYFTLFFGGLLGLYVIVRRNTKRLYDLREVLTVLFGGLLTIVLFIPWLLPYLLGARPEYTTGITVRFVPFSETAGQPLVTSFMGIETETSFVSYLHHVNTYSIAGTSGNGGILLLLMLVISLIVLTTTLAFGSFDRLALYGAGLLSMVFSTGPLVHGLALFNRTVYDNIPLFNADPSLIRWLTVTTFVYSLLLGIGLSDLSKSILARRIQPGLIPRLISRRWKDRRSGRSGNPKLPVVRLRRAHPPWAGKGLVACAYLSVVGLIVLQNGLVLTYPPASFQFPASYTEGITYIADQRSIGGTLAIPFSETYELTPWAGISSPASLMAFTWTQSNTVVFEAGTPYSLAMDQFVGNGLTYDLSGKMVKFLEASNIEYILATKYHNWSQASSYAYDPIQSYYSFMNQSGIGNPVFRGGLQTVYELHNVSGNISFAPTYYVYFVPDSQLYQVLNQPWYFGASQPLINGSTLGSELPIFIDHSSGIIVPAVPPANLSEPIALAQSDGVPVMDPSGHQVGGGARPRLPRSPPAFYPDTTYEPNPTSISYTEPVSGWGLLVLDQTYSDLLSVQGASGQAFHALVDIGLNAWLMDAENGSRLTIRYLGDNYLSTSLLVEVASGSLIVGSVTACMFLKRWRRRGRPISKRLMRRKVIHATEAKVAGH